MAEAIHSEIDRLKKEDIGDDELGFVRVERERLAVRVHREDEIRSRRPARCLDPLGIRLGRESAHLELAAGHARAAIAFHLAADVAERLARHVVAPDADDGQPPPVAAEERRDALAQGLADQVPERRVHAGDGLHEGLLVAALVAAGEELLPDALPREDVLTAQARGQLVVDQADDLEAVLAVVAVVDLADEALVGAHPGDDRGALEDGIGAPAEVLRERDVDGDGLDAVDAHGRVPRSRRRRGIFPGLPGRADDEARRAPGQAN